MFRLIFWIPAVICSRSDSYGDAENSLESAEVDSQPSHLFLHVNRGGDNGRSFGMTRSQRIFPSGRGGGGFVQPVISVSSDSPMRSSRDSKKKAGQEEKGKIRPRKSQAKNSNRREKKNVMSDAPRINDLTDIFQKNKIKSLSAVKVGSRKIEDGEHLDLAMEVMNSVVKVSLV